jgi:hypothetical protein
VKEQEDAGGSGYGPRHPRVPAASTSGAQGHKSSLGGVARMGSANAAMQSAMQQASSSVMGAGLPSSYYPGGPASVTPSRIGIGGPPVPSRRTRQRHRVPPQRESLFGLLVTASKLHNMEGLPGEDGGMLMPSAAYQDPLAAAAQWGSVTMYGRSGAPAYVDDEAYGGASGPAAPGLKPREEWDPNRYVVSRCLQAGNNHKLLSIMNTIQLVCHGRKPGVSETAQQGHCICWELHPSAAAVLYWGHILIFPASASWHLWQRGVPPDGVPVHQWRCSVRPPGAGANWCGRVWHCVQR